MPLLDNPLTSHVTSVPLLVANTPSFSSLSENSTRRPVPPSFPLRSGPGENLHMAWQKPIDQPVSTVVNASVSQAAHQPAHQLTSLSSGTQSSPSTHEPLWLLKLGAGQKVEAESEREREKGKRESGLLGYVPDTHFLRSCCNCGPLPTGVSSPICTQERCARCFRVRWISESSVQQKASRQASKQACMDV